VSAEENKEKVRRFMEEAFGQDKPELLEDLLDPDFVRYDPYIEAGEVRGVQTVKDNIVWFHNVFPDLTCTIEDQVAEGDKVVTRWSASGTHQGETEELGPPTGNRMEITGISIERISEGKVVESWDNYDAMGMMQQLGHIPSPEQQAQA
jgi:predicted ester cyclase